MILGFWFMFMRTKFINIHVLPQQFDRLASTLSLSKSIYSGLWIHRWAMSVTMSSKARSPERGLGPESRSRVLGVILTSLLISEMWYSLWSVISDLLVFFVSSGTCAICNKMYHRHMILFKPEG